MVTLYTSYLSTLSRVRPATIGAPAEWVDNRHDFTFILRYIGIMVEAEYGLGMRTVW